MNGPINIKNKTVSSCNLLKFSYKLYSPISIVMKFKLPCGVTWAPFLAITRKRRGNILFLLPQLKK